MKHWRINDDGFHGKTVPGICNQNCTLFEVYKLPNGSIEFREACDQYYNIQLTKEEAKQFLTEALEWLDHE